MRTTMGVVAALTFVAAVGCSSAEEPSTSTGEETSLLEKARHGDDGKKDHDRKDDGKKDKDDRVERAKLDPTSWGKPGKDMRSFSDFMKKKKLDVKEAKRIFFDVSNDTKEGFFDLSKDVKDDFFDESGEASRRLFDKLDAKKEGFFDLSKDAKEGFFDLSKDARDDVFDGKKEDGRTIVWDDTGDGMPDVNTPWGRVPWGDVNDGNDEKDHEDGDPSDD